MNGTNSGESKEESIVVDELISSDVRVVGLGSSMLLGEDVGGKDFWNLENVDRRSSDSSSFRYLLGEGSDVSISGRVAMKIDEHRNGGAVSGTALT